MNRKFLIIIIICFFSTNIWGQSLKSISIRNKQLQDSINFDFDLLIQNQNLINWNNLTINYKTSGSDRQFLSKMFHVSYKNNDSCTNENFIFKLNNEFGIKHTVNKTSDARPDIFSGDHEYLEVMGKSYDLDSLFQNKYGRNFLNPVLTYFTNCYKTIFKGKSYLLFEGYSRIVTLNAAPRYWILFDISDKALPVIYPFYEQIAFFTDTIKCFSDFNMDGNLDYLKFPDFDIKEKMSEYINRQKNPVSDFETIHLFSIKNKTFEMDNDHYLIVYLSPILYKKNNPSPFMILNKKSRWFFDIGK